MRDLSFDSPRHQRDFKLAMQMYSAWQANQQQLFDIEAAALKLVKKAKRTARKKLK